MDARTYGRAGRPVRRFVLWAFIALLILTGCGKQDATPGGGGAGKPAEEADETVAGALDGVSGEGISGWVWDSKRPDSPLEVDIFDGDAKLATVPADEFREDLLQAKVGNGKHGFGYPLPAGLRDGKPHTIRVTIARTGKDLVGSPKTVAKIDTAPGGGGAAKPAEETVGGTLDGVSAEGISGWAWDSKRPDSPIKVDIFDGDTKVATVAADEFREDLLKAKIGNGKHGFGYPTPARLKDGKSHTIRVTVAGTDKELDGSPQTLRSP